jgi:type IV pilus assembly protein PilE
MAGAMRVLNGFTAIGRGRSIAPGDPGGTKMRISRPTGFTLLELMVVVAVIAVLAVIALPSFVEQIRKGKRAEAVRAIGDIQLRQERYRADNPRYATMDELTGGATNTANYNGALSYYNISVTGNNATDYVITATRKGDLANDPRCGNFILTQDIVPPATVVSTVKSMSSGDVDYCWRQ